MGNRIQDPRRERRCLRLFGGVVSKGKEKGIWTEEKVESWKSNLLYLYSSSSRKEKTR